MDLHKSNNTEEWRNTTLKSAQAKAAERQANFATSSDIQKYRMSQLLLISGNFDVSSNWAIPRVPIYTVAICVLGTALATRSIDRKLFVQQNAYAEYGVDGLTRLLGQASRDDLHRVENDKIAEHRGSP